MYERLSSNITLIVASFTAMGALVAGCGYESSELELSAGLTQLERGNYQSAIDLLESAAAKRPEDASIPANLGVAYWRIGQAERAIESLELAARLDESDPRPLEFIGQVLMEENLWGKAGKAFDRALKRSPQSPRILTALAVVEMHLGRTVPAADHLEKALRCDRNYAPALYNLAVLHRDAVADREEAGRLFRRFIEVAGQDRHVDIAKNFLSGEEAKIPAPVEAVNSNETPSPAQPLIPVAKSPIVAKPQIVVVPTNISQRVVDKEPEQPPVKPASQNKEEKQAEEKKVVTKPRPSDEPPPSKFAKGNKSLAMKAWALGLKAHRSKNLDEAIVYYERALKYDDQLVSASYNLGLAYKDKGSYENARKAFDLTLELNPRMTKAIYLLAVIAWKQKQYDRSAVYLERALATDPDYANAHYLLASVYDARRQKDPAILHYERYLKLAPDTPSAAKARRRLKTIRR